MLVETARFWHSLGHHDRHGHWHIDGATGPDEYTAVVRDNVFTNLMAAHNLRIAAAACERNPELAEVLEVSTEEAAGWCAAARAVHVPYDEELGVHQQCEGFTRLREWSFSENTSYPLLLHEPYVRLYPAQVIKQADLVLAMHWLDITSPPRRRRATSTTTNGAPRVIRRCRRARRRCCAPKWATSNWPTTMPPRQL